MGRTFPIRSYIVCFSALQRAENSSKVLAPDGDGLHVLLFQCSSASRKFLKRRWSGCNAGSFRVSVLFSEPKIPQTYVDPDAADAHLVSVLFSEPKIPQMYGASGGCVAISVFQCSSASRKFLKTSVTSQHARPVRVSVLFSEPKIPQTEIDERIGDPNTGFQCSSASRKFLKLLPKNDANHDAKVSVLFSEPKIPQMARSRRRRDSRTQVSVLFSEPKIPQTFFRSRVETDWRGFSALQRAENSSKWTGFGRVSGLSLFQCSSASRKFLK